jgi:hypothetical protein
MRMIFLFGPGRAYAVNNMKGKMMTRQNQEILLKMLSRGGLEMMRGET